MFKRDQIVNIEGILYDIYGGLHSSSGALSVRNINNRPNTAFGHIEYFHQANMVFKASNSNGVTTGDRVMPRTVFENLYVIISEEFLRLILL